MANRRQVLVVVLALLAVVIAAAVAFLADRDASVADAGTEPPPPLDYTFRWRDGAVRSVDVPMQIYIRAIDVTVPLYPVKDMRSEPGEDKVAFLQRVRAELANYSNRQTHEACGEICSDGAGNHSIRITSTAATAYCAVAPICMDGQASIGESIHSHCPDRGRLRATRVDEYLSGGVLRDGEPFGHCVTDRFSQRDLAGRKPGWLAGRRALYRHEGPGKVTRIE